MSFEVKVPRLAESISEATLVEWLKADGASVRTDEPIATLETDKAAVEIVADTAGVLTHARKPGDVVKVGDVLARIGAAEASTAAPASATPPSAAPAPAPAPTKPGAAEASPAAGAVESKPTGAARTTAAPALSPAVRRIVEERALDPAAITGTGPGGRILKEDALREAEAARAGAEGPARPARPGPPVVANLPAAPA